MVFACFGKFDPFLLLLRGDARLLLRLVGLQSSFLQSSCDYVFANQGLLLDGDPSRCLPIGSATPAVHMLNNTISVATAQRSRGPERFLSSVSSSARIVHLSTVERAHPTSFAVAAREYPCFLKVWILTRFFCLRVKDFTIFGEVFFS